MQAVLEPIKSRTLPNMAQRSINRNIKYVGLVFLKLYRYDTEVAHTRQLTHTDIHIHGWIWWCLMFTLQTWVHSYKYLQWFFAVDLFLKIANMKYSGMTNMHRLRIKTSCLTSYIQKTHWRPSLKPSYSGVAVLIMSFFYSCPLVCEF